MNPLIQILLVRKQKADALPVEIRNKYAEEYNRIIAELAQCGLSYPLPVWDEQINSEILSIIFRDMAQKYEMPQHKPFVNWIHDQVIHEIDASFGAMDPERLFICIQTVNMQLSKI